jgi:hypothetical protein
MNGLCKVNKFERLSLYMTQDKKIKEGVDYYINESGLVVFTATYLLERGYCCKNGCRHCPYGFDKKTKK